MRWDRRSRWHWLSWLILRLFFLLRLRTISTTTTRSSVFTSSLLFSIFLLFLLVLNNLERVLIRRWGRCSRRWRIGLLHLPSHGLLLNSFYYLASTRLVLHVLFNLFKRWCELGWGLWTIDPKGFIHLLALQCVVSDRRVMWAFIFWFVSCGPSGSHSVLLLLLFDLVFLLLLGSYSIFLFIKRFHLVRQKLVFLFLVIKRFLETLCLFWLGCP